MPARTVDRAVVDAVTRGLMDKGLIVEAGWKGLELMAIPANASETQRIEMRMAFFAGAQHLFSSIMGGLEAGTEETAADLRRMDQIANELERFAAEFKQQRMQ